MNVLPAYTVAASPPAHADIVQPKIDGIRCRVSCDGWFSRTGKRFPFTSVDVPPGIILDGELHRPGLSPASVAAIAGRGHREGLTFSVFDARILAGASLPFHERMDIAMPVILRCGFEMVPAVPVTDVGSQYHAFLLAGFEGAVFRVSSASYGQPGTAGKRKPTEDAEFRIVSVTGASVTCRTDAGAVFRVPASKATAGARQGRRMKIRFCGYTSKGLPRDAVALGIRPWWDILPRV